MEKYTKQSYEPVRLSVTNSGNSGMNGEPGSLVNGDLIAQNLLYLAYDEPITVHERVFYVDSVESVIPGLTAVLPDEWSHNEINYLAANIP